MTRSASPACGAHREGIEPVLRIEGILGVGAAQARGDDSPARILAEDIVSIDGLMRPVEGSDAEMHDPGRYGSACHRPGGELFRQIGKRSLRSSELAFVLKVWSIKVLRLLPSPLWGGIKGGGVGAGPSLVSAYTPTSNSSPQGGGGLPALYGSDSQCAGCCFARVTICVGLTKRRAMMSHIRVVTI